MTPDAEALFRQAEQHAAEEDWENAFYSYDKAVKAGYDDPAGDAPALHWMEQYALLEEASLSSIHARPEALPEDASEEEIERWSCRIASNALTEGMVGAVSLAIAERYEIGRGVNQDRRKANYWLSKAVAYGQRPREGSPFFKASVNRQPPAHDRESRPSDPNSIPLWMWIGSLIGVTFLIVKFLKFVLSL